MKLTGPIRVSQEGFNKLITEGVEPDAALLAESATEAGSGAERYTAELAAQFNKAVAHNHELRERAEKAEAKAVQGRKAEGAWIVAALKRYPQNWAFDATNPELVIANIVSGASAEANNKTGEIESLFNVVMREIKELAQDALGYDQICDPIQAVRRLAQEFAAVKAQLADAEREVEHSHEIIIGQNEEIVKAKAQLAKANARAEAAEKHAEITCKTTDESLACVERLRKELNHWKREFSGNMPSSEIDARVVAANERAEKAEAKAEGWQNRCQEVMAKLDGQSYLVMKLELDAAKADAARLRATTIEECAQLAKKVIDERTFSGGTKGRIGSIVADEIRKLRAPEPTAQIGKEIYAVIEPDCDHPFRVTGDSCLNCGEMDTDAA